VLATGPIGERRHCDTQVRCFLWGSRLLRGRTLCGRDAHGRTTAWWSAGRTRLLCRVSAARRRVGDGLLARGSDVALSPVERALAPAPVQAGGGQDAGAPATGTNCAKPSKPNTRTSVKTMFVRASFPSRKSGMPVGYDAGFLQGPFPRGATGRACSLRLSSPAGVGAYLCSSRNAVATRGSNWLPAAHPSASAGVARSTRLRKLTRGR